MRVCQCHFSDSTSFSFGHEAKPSQGRRQRGLHACLYIRQRPIYIYHLLHSHTLTQPLWGAEGDCHCHPSMSSAQPYLMTTNRPSGLPQRADLYSHFTVCTHTHTEVHMLHTQTVSSHCRLDVDAIAWKITSCFILRRWWQSERKFTPITMRTFSRLYLVQNTSIKTYFHYFTLTKCVLVCLCSFQFKSWNWIQFAKWRRCLGNMKNVIH